MRVIKCPNCGANVQIENNKCPYCNSHFKKQEIIDNEVKNVPTSSFPNFGDVPIQIQDFFNDTMKSSKKLVILPIIFTIIFFVIFAFIVVTALSNF